MCKEEAVCRVDYSQEKLNKMVGDAENVRPHIEKTIAGRIKQARGLAEFAQEVESVVDKSYLYTLSLQGMKEEIPASRYDEIYQDRKEKILELITAFCKEYLGINVVDDIENEEKK